MLKTFCPECGPEVTIDEDGCCIICGSNATGQMVEEAMLYWDYCKKFDMDFST